MYLSIRSLQNLMKSSLQLIQSFLKSSASRYVPVFIYIIVCHHSLHFAALRLHFLFYGESLYVSFLIVFFFNAYHDNVICTWSWGNELRIISPFIISHCRHWPLIQRMAAPACVVGFLTRHLSPKCLMPSLWILFCCKLSFFFLSFFF